MKPEFVDNRDGNTMAAAIRGHLAWYTATYKEPVEVAIATGYFNPGGFAQVAHALEGLKRVRLLLGAEPTPPIEPRRKRSGEARGQSSVTRSSAKRWVGPKRASETT